MHCPLLCFLSLLLVFSYITSDVHANTPSLPYTKVINTSYKVTYDSRAILINDERILLLSGSFHYPRATSDMWLSILTKMKESGLNTVQLYIFWDLHEPVPYEYDFTSSDRNLTQLFQIIKDIGLFINLRIGPYVCAEWRLGKTRLYVTTTHN